MSPPSPFSSSSGPAKHASIPCRFFARGFCSRGTGCWYAHVQPSPPSSSPPKPFSISPAPSASRQPKEKDPCSICFEPPSQYGLMTGCAHVFCLQCIRHWRAQPHKKSTEFYDDTLEPTPSTPLSKTCPLCRVPTRYVVPSYILPATPGEKGMIEEAYRRNLQRIPCKFFEESLGLAPSSPSSNSGSGSSSNTPFNPTATTQKDEWSTREKGKGRGKEKEKKKEPASPKKPAPKCPFGNDCFYRHALPDEKERYVFSEKEMTKIKWEARGGNRKRRGRRHRLVDEDEGAEVRYLGVLMLGDLSDDEDNEEQVYEYYDRDLWEEENDWDLDVDPWLDEY